MARQVFAPMKQMKSFGEKRAGRIPHKYVVVNGIEFDSQSEADRYMELLVLQKAGRITELEVQPHFELIPTQRIPGKQCFRKHGYTADFRYKDDNGVDHIEDVKSKRTREERDYIINRKLMYMLLGLYVEEVLR